MCFCVSAHVHMPAFGSFPRSSALWWQIANCPFQALLYKHFKHIKILTALSLGLNPKFPEDTILLAGFSWILTSDAIRQGYGGGPRSPKLLTGPHPVDLISSPQREHSQPALESTLGQMLARQSLCSPTSVVMLLRQATSSGPALPC